MKVIDMGEKPSILNHFVAELRDVDIQRDPLRFRTNLQRIGQIQAYEVSRYLSYSQKFVQTPLGTAVANTPDDTLVISTVLRAGLPLHEGFLSVFDRAENAFVSAYRFYKDKECTELDVHIEYIASPEMEGKTLVMVDPMLATGESMELAIEALLTRGKPKRIIMACAIASRPGVQHLEKVFGGREDVLLFCAAIDPELNARSYIVPGLGDAGDLAFGAKLSL